MPVIRKNQNTPMIENAIEVMMDNGYSVDSNKAAITMKMSAIPSNVLTIMICWVSSLRSNPRPKRHE